MFEQILHPAHLFSSSSSASSLSVRALFSYLSINRFAYYEKGERKKRTHRLCTIAGTLESIAPGIKELTLPEVIELLEHIFSDTEVKRMVHNWVLLHRQKYREVDSGGFVPHECDTD